MAIFSAVASSILNGFESRDREKISDGRLYVEVEDNLLGVIGINSKLKDCTWMVDRVNLFPLSPAF